MTGGYIADMNQAIPVPAFSDNYIWLLPASGNAGDGEADRHVAIVDPGDAKPVLRALDERGLAPIAILVTHHHFDHTGGLRELRTRLRVPVYGPANSRIPGLDHTLRDGDRITVGGALELDVIEVPGHTLDHIAYAGNGLLLCGDTLFAGGCGRLFEGTAEQMYDSLARLAALPDETRVYCAHEYTLANLEFAARVEPENDDLRRRLAETRQLRDDDRVTLPSTLGDERRTNPFLRCDIPTVAAAAERYSNRHLENPTEVFAAIRSWKDAF